MSKIKEIWCMHHSHLDVGYTHPQPLLLELQSDYIEQAIDLCIETSDYPEESRFRWTVEANYPLRRWLETARPERVDLLKQFVREGQISLAALPMHTTPGADAGEALHMLEDLDQLRALFDAKMATAVNHDVNGQPWPLSQFLLDSGVNFYLTGINIHFGGIPFNRPSAFRWETPDGRELLTFLGEHYSLFSQFFYTYEADTEKMHEGVTKYVARLEQNGYDKDFAFLTATNPPLFDNNCPDLQLADLIRRYNEEGHEQKIRFVTPEMLRDKLIADGVEKLPVYAGDWTDYWNFGCGSTARETRVNRLAKQAVRQAEMLECVNGSPNPQYDRVKAECLQSSLLFDEHTWGASQSVTAPDDPETQAQKIQKYQYAYDAAAKSAYLLSTQMELLCNNPHQSGRPEGIVVVNPTGTEQRAELEVPASYLKEERQLAALRSKQYVPYLKGYEETVFMGAVQMPPFSWRTIPFSLLREEDREKQYTVKDGEITTPYYRVVFNRTTGRIRQIYDKVQKRELLDEESPWAFFEAVRETVDGRWQNQSRAALFPRDVELGNLNITVWQHDWKADRRGAESVEKWRVEEKPGEVSLIWESHMEGMEKMEQSVTFSASYPRVMMKAWFVKKPVSTPESIYFAFPLKMKKNWDCSFDTMRTYVRLDEEQLGNVCRDWLTVDKSISMYDDSVCMTLFCPDAPMVQPGGFHFGHESRVIAREKDPLLLAWPLNNYWDTNFNADQSGAMEFSYGFEAFDHFEPERIYGESLAAENACVIGAAVQCKESEGCLLKGKGDVAVLYVHPSRFIQAGRKTMVVLLKNMTKQDQKYEFTVPDCLDLNAWEVTVQEREKEVLEVCGLTGTIEMPAGALKLIRISCK